MTEVVHILDRFVPELQQYLLIEDIGCYLIAEGLLSNEDYLTLVRRTSKKEAIVELLQLVKRKGPDCLESFMHALHRSCTESSTPHQGHLHLWQLLQGSMSGAHAHPLKKQKSKSLLSLLSRNKNSKSNKELCSRLWISTPHSTAIKFNPSYSSATTPLGTFTSRRPIVNLSGASSTYDEENHRYSSSCSEDSYNPEIPLPPPPPTADNTQQCLTEALQKESEELKTNLKKKEKELEKSKATLKEQLLHIEELKTRNEKYKSKIQTLEAQVEHLALQLEANEQMTEHDSLIDDLEKQVTFLQFKNRKIMREKESLKKIVLQGSMIPTRGPNSTRRSGSLDHGASESLLATRSTSLTSINEIEELKCELNKKDAVLHSKLDHIVQICQDMQEPSKLNRKWHSDIRLVQRHHQDNNSLSLHSQT